MTDTAIYLDYAAATPLDPSVLKAMQPYLASDFGNPSSLYELARRAKYALEGSRAEVAGVIGAKKSEIIFTAGATEAINLAIQGVARRFPGKKLVATAIEHEAVLATQAVLKESGWGSELVRVRPNGLVDLEKLEAAIDDETVLVNLMYANNEIGTIQPLARAVALIEKIRANRRQTSNPLPLYLHSDAAQAANYLDLHVSRLGVDLMSLNGSKIYGPKQTGILYVRTGVTMMPLIYGGGQERGWRSGTENVAGAVGFATALNLVQSLRKIEAKRQGELRDQLLAGIQSSIAGLRINGDMTKRLPNNLNISIPGADGEALVMALDARGLAASTGSACSTGRLDPSHVLQALGLDKKQCNSSLRLTLGRLTTRAEINQALKLLPEAVQYLR